MWLERALRSLLRRMFVSRSPIALERRPPALEDSFQDVRELGLYLHVPFCRQICPYCPYNKVLYEPAVARRYAAAVHREIDLYAEMIGDRPVTSVYIGGGTPTTMLYDGLDGILEHVSGAFDMRCDVHMESHPNDLSPENLAAITAMGVQHLSIGVEALQDRHLRTLHRPYKVQEVRAAVERALGVGFRCVNVDTIFALPGQTRDEVREAGRMLVEMAPDQITAYPLFYFPYTAWARIARENSYRSPSVLTRRAMLRILEGLFYGAGYERTSVWAFTRPGAPKYCSVTVPLYVGLGASGGSYLRDVFYLNTFNVGEYIQALEAGSLPIALSLELSAEMQRAGWLYWRIYETRFRKSDYQRRFGEEFDRAYGRQARVLSAIGFLKGGDDELVLSDEGIYWLHVLEDLFSVGYVGQLWGTSQSDPWPERVVLA